LIKKNRIVALVVLAILATLGMSACSISGDTVTDPSLVTLRYQGGFNEGSKFKECLEPGTKIATDDKLYPYPTTQRENVWNSDQYHKASESADHDDLMLFDKNGIPVYAKVKVAFQLNTSCEPKTIEGKRYEGGTLQAYHELIGRTRGAFFHNDGTYGGEKSGWIWAMDNYITTPVEDSLRVQAKHETADDLWKDESVKQKLQDTLKKNIDQMINDGMETDEQFYTVTSVKIYSVTPDKAYVDLYTQRQTAKTAAETAEFNKRAKVAEAEANAAVARSEAKIKRAEISAFRSEESYLKEKAIESGMNPWLKFQGVTPNTPAQ
jgi:hypothetical protein